MHTSPSILNLQDLATALASILPTPLNQHQHQNPKEHMDMSTTSTPPLNSPVSAAAQPPVAQPQLRLVEEQSTILARAEQLQNEVAEILLDQVSTSSRRIAETLGHAARKVELGMAIASQRFVDDAIGEILEGIEAQRETLRGRLGAKSLSKAQKALLQSRLLMLDRQEEAVLTKLGGIDTAKLLGDSSSSSSQASAS